MTRVRPCSSSRLGFTLVEVMIVVVCMAILTAVVIPQFTDGAKDARVNTAKFNLQQMRSQLELYRQHHNGLLPGNTLAEMLAKTNQAGTMGATAAYSLGPYCMEIPLNPLTRSNVVRVSSSNPPTAASGAVDAGWLYHRASGGFWIDDQDLLGE